MAKSEALVESLEDAQQLLRDAHFWVELGLSGQATESTKEARKQFLQAVKNHFHEGIEHE